MFIGILHWKKTSTFDFAVIFKVNELYDEMAYLNGSLAILLLVLSAGVCECARTPVKISLGAELNKNSVSASDVSKGAKVRTFCAS